MRHVHLPDGRHLHIEAVPPWNDLPEGHCIRAAEAALQAAGPLSGTVAHIGLGAIGGRVVCALDLHAVLVAVYMNPAFGLFLWRWPSPAEYERLVALGTQELRQRDAN